MRPDQTEAATEVSAHASGTPKPDSNAKPQPWFGSEEQRGLQQRLRSAPKRILLLDYDGTLAPFHADKMQATPYPGVETLLSRLRRLPAVRLVLVTGRRASDLERLIGIARHLEIWGSHGREHLAEDRKYTFYPPTEDQSRALQALQKGIEASLAGVPLRLDTTHLSIQTHHPSGNVEVPEPLERKPASIAIHWRGLAPESQLQLQETAEAEYTRLGSSSIERLPFASGVEFRAAGYTKAFAVDRILEQSQPNDALAYLGDDLTDEDAFAAVQSKGISMLVLSEPRNSNARFWIQPPEDLLRFLEEWGA